MGTADTVSGSGIGAGFDLQLYISSDSAADRYSGCEAGADEHCADSVCLPLLCDRRGGCVVLPYSHLVPAVRECYIASFFPLRLGTVSFDPCRAEKTQPRAQLHRNIRPVRAFT